MRTNKVYLVTEGWYSDYGVVAIFAKKEDAEAYKAARIAGSRYHEFNEIEEHDLLWSVPVVKPLFKGK